jgi:uncharacterized protein (TIGR02466 family)
MNHKTVGLFAQPVTRIDLDVNGVANFFDTVVKSSGGETNQDRGFGDTGLVHYHNETNVFKLYDELKDLGNEILDAANFVYQDVMNHTSKLFFTNAWFNECSVGSSQFMHTHGNSVLSGTLYIRTDENTNIQFQTPFGASEVSNTLEDTPDTDRRNKFGYVYHFHHCNFNVRDGVCLFWPSYMKHGYHNNQTPNRLSLSFNLMPESFNSMYNPYFSS